MRTKAKKKSSALLALLLAAMLTVVMMPTSAFATEKTMAPEVQTAYEETGKWLTENVTNPVVSSTGGEWAILGLARAGYPVPEGYYEKYYQNVVKEVQNKVSSDGHEVLNNKITDNARVILALTALGYDVSDVGGHNLLLPLSDQKYANGGLINSTIYILIAIDAYNYEIPAVYDGGTQASKEHIIEKLLNLKLSGGGWALFGSKVDPDITFMTVQALAPYYDSNEQVKEAVDAALTVMSAKQNENGTFGSWGTSSNSESVAQAIVALTALGIDPEEDTRFIKGENSLIDGLMNFYVEGGGFKHSTETKANGIATEQAYYALAAYDRFLKGKNSLYDMTDVVMQPKKIDAETAISEVGAAQSGATVEVEADGASILPKELLEAAKGKDVSVVIDMGGYKWTVNGRDITAESLKDVDLTVIVTDTEKELADKAAALAAGNPTKEIKLAYSGDFGFKGVLTVNLDAANAGKTANLFYYNAGKELEFVYAGKVAANGDCSLEFTHASDYVVVLADKKITGTESVSGTGDEGTGDDSTAGSGGTVNTNGNGTGLSGTAGNGGNIAEAESANGADAQTAETDGVPKTGDESTAGAWILTALAAAATGAMLKKRMTGGRGDRAA